MKCKDYNGWSVLCQSCIYPLDISCSKDVEEDKETEEGFVAPDVKSNRKETFILLLDLDGYKYKIVKDQEGYENHNHHKIEVEYFNYLSEFLIEDEEFKNPYIYGILNINSNKKSLKNVIAAVKKIEDYNYDTLVDILLQIFVVETKSLPEDRIYF